jgi:hypothetical protein
MLAKRIVRYLCLDRNPLRRRLDVIDAWLTVALAALLLAGPLVAGNLGNAVYRNRLSTSDVVLQAAFPAEAVPADAGTLHDLVDPSARQVWATWDGVVGGVIAMLALTAVGFGLWLVARRSLDRRRAAAWQAAWGLIEQEWSGRW